MINVVNIIINYESSDNNYKSSDINNYWLCIICKMSPMTLRNHGLRYSFPYPKKAIL